MTEKVDLEGKVMTVTGPIEAVELGVTLPHEHLLIDHTPHRVVLSDRDLAVQELMIFAGAGGHTVVELSSGGIGRDPTGLRTISEATGVNIVMGCGYYKRKWHPSDMDRRTVDQLEEEMVSDIFQGVGETGIRAGIIGEIGVTDSLEGNEEKCVIASAQAQIRTGVALNFHVHLNDKVEEEKLRTLVLDAIQCEGVDLNRVIMSHFEPDPSSVDYHHRIAQRGVYIEYDLFGMAVFKGEAIPGYEEEIAALKELIERGHLERILISQDVCFKRLLVKNGGWGYAHILNHVIPRFKTNGITEAEVHTIVEENPRRVFPFSS
jgi:phosphotriesterase-related protein